MTKLSFPKDFLWGVATAAHQVEGNNINSDAWLMEQLPGTMYEELSGDACDFYHLYREDIDLISELGFNSFRLGVEWGRIEPTPGQFSKSELDHYSRIVDYCLEKGIVPVITLQHFTSPIWLISEGGWRSPDTPKKFARYSKKVMEVLGDRVKWVCTINESNTPLQLTINGLLTGDINPAIERATNEAAKYFFISPEEFSPFFPNATDEKSIENLIEAHKLAVEEIHSLNMDINVGVTLSLQNIVELEPCQDAKDVKENINKRFLRDMGRIGDFVGVQNYTTIKYNSKGKVEERENLSDAGVVLDPVSLAETCKLAYEITKKPILITEHGVDFGDEKDPIRIKFVEDSLRELYRSMDEDKIDVRGYMHWSFLDNFEWFRGYNGQFGLVKVDRTTQVRTPRPSAHALGKISKDNGL